MKRAYLLTNIWSPIACLLLLLPLVSNAHALSLARTDVRAYGLDAAYDFDENPSFASSTASNPSNGNHAYAEADAAYAVLRDSITAGWVGAYAQSVIYDEFTLLGLPPGPVVITVSLTVRGSISLPATWFCCPYVDVFATLYPSAEPPASGWLTYLSGYPPYSVAVWAGGSPVNYVVDTVLSADLNITAGTPFGLVYGLSVGANSNPPYATADFLNSASLSFSIPDGAWISSAGGFGAQIPEPSTFLLLGGGMGGLAIWRRLKAVGRRLRSARKLADLYAAGARRLRLTPRSPITQ